MGFPLAPVGAGQFFFPGHQTAQDSKNDPTQLPPVHRQSSSRESHHDRAHRASDAADQGGSNLSGGDFYEVSAGVVLQQQLFFLAATGGTADAQTSANAVTGTSPAVPANTGQATGSSSASSTQAPEGSSSASSPATSTTGATGADGATAVTSLESGSSAIPSSATLKQEEAQLQQALQQLGLSPAAIQQFTYESQLLAQLAPGLFQEFLSYVLQIAAAGEPSSPVSTAGATAGAGGSAPPSSSASAAGQQNFELEFGSVQVTQAELSITPGQNGGETVTFEAASATASFASLQTGSSSSTQPAASTASTPPPANQPSTKANASA